MAGTSCTSADQRRMGSGRGLDTELQPRSRAAEDSSRGAAAMAQTGGGAKRYSWQGVEGGWVYFEFARIRCRAAG